MLPNMAIDLQPLRPRAKYLAYADAVQAIRRFSVHTPHAYRALPPAVRDAAGLPPSPESFYQGSGWTSWEAFLPPAPSVLDYEAARQLLATLGITQTRQYHSLTTQVLLDLRLPYDPRLQYRPQWISWSHFLNQAGRRRHRTPPKDGFVSYTDAKKAVVELGIRTAREYAGLSKAVLDGYRLPSRPAVCYRRSGWQNWKAFLRDNLAIVDYETARQLVAEQGLVTMTEYRHAYRMGLLPHALPSLPRQHYAETGWQGARHFFGLNPRFLPYEQAARVVRQLGLRSSQDYHRLSVADRRRYRLPSQAPAYYADKGWRSWATFLDIERGRYVPYEQAQRLARELGIQTSRQWQGIERQMRRRLGLPASPHAYYAGKGWVSWPIFLGKPSYIAVPFDEARHRAATLNIRTGAQWQKIDRQRLSELELPAYPNAYYRGRGWQGWKHFLALTPPSAPPASASP
jgi:hypothetical protein